MTVLLTGATGTVGSRLVPILVGRAPLRALARSDVAARSLAAAGVTDVIRGDVTDVACLHSALAGVDRFLLLTPYDEQQGRTEVAAVEAALRAGVEHIVLLSVHGVPDETLVRAGHAAAEAQLERSGVPSTVVQADTFATNLLDTVSTVVNGVLAFPAGDVRLAHVDPSDIAAVIAHVLTTDDPPRGVVTVTGPEALSYGDVAVRVSDAVGSEVRYVDVPPADWHAGLLAAGVPPFYAEGLSDLFAALRERGDGEVSRQTEQLLGRAATPVDVVLREELAPLVHAAREGRGGMRPG